LTESAQATPAVVEPSVLRREFVTTLTLVGEVFLRVLPWRDGLEMLRVDAAWNLADVVEKDAWLERAT
jgi:hypothetical protein